MDDLITGKVGPRKSLLGDLYFLKYIFSTAIRIEITVQQKKKKKKKKEAVLSQKHEAAHFLFPKDCFKISTT